MANFPKEIWEMILDEVEDSKDILQVLKSSPFLNNSFHGRKRYWLIGQAISQLVTYKLLGPDDILKCRLVCKQWSKRICYFLENQFTLSAYDHEIHKEVAKDYFEPITYVCKKPIGAKFHSELTNFAKIKEEHLDKYHNSRNPFVSKMITLIITDGRPHQFFWSGLFHILEKFGRHIFHFQMIFSANNNSQIQLPYGFFKTLVWILSFLPNLKYLRFDKRRDVPLTRQHFNCDSSSSQITYQFPNLSYLETIKISTSSIPLNFVDTLLPRFGGQLRRLDIPLDYWKPHYYSMFPNLTEIDINDETMDYPTDEVDFISLDKIPQTLISPKLVKLHLGFSIQNMDLEASYVFQWLKRFPLLKYFNIGDDCRRVRHNANGYFIRETNYELNTVIPNLQIFVLRDSSEIPYNFLLSFPALRHLVIFLRHIQPVVTDLSESKNIRLNLREAKQTGQLYDTNIWELLPNLMTITLFKIDELDGKFDEQYDWERWKYDIWKKGNNGVKKEFKGFSSLRQDILDWLGLHEEDNNNSSRSSYYDSSDSEIYLGESENESGEDEGGSYQVD